MAATPFLAGSLYRMFGPSGDGAADETFHNRTSVIVAGGAMFWVAVLLNDWFPALRASPNVWIALWLVILGLYPVGYLFYSISMLGGHQVLTASASQATYLVVAAVIAHIGFFSAVYEVIDTLATHQFTERLTSVSAVYLAATTFTSVGSGILAPTGGAARIAVAIESVLSVLIIVVGVSFALRRWERRLDNRGNSPR